MTKKCPKKASETQKETQNVYEEQTKHPKRNTSSPKTQKTRTKLKPEHQREFKQIGCRTTEQDVYEEQNRHKTTRGDQSQFSSWTLPRGPGARHRTPTGTG
ncbi:hypothetical protein NQZ68_035691 [Dissostichus eleginoides]|nr:hypothetical protein NQZ68_035691 [Dissostichus eleginoides]